ncbi:Mannosylglycoprotein endo-beta-mannosidase [Capsicum annuum]|uniref:Mannosylglycoprotein endo-beta-mannosidase n=1 Tax=Capsicum annuum TaxID=4072 RepID=A0A2G2Z605_CAPAN|nr:Mannosylglycoprotein endo-beta-mannosidase [Capsicum annuum]KAF3667456.1 Mannosylglycoprotein endo-beta-mannosidase [Capsicum annuum]PHT77423.1 Mannosylglycoprotein endo-beta-mannosidase [Capsicum annuum]
MAILKKSPVPYGLIHKYIPYSKPVKVHDQILPYGTPKDVDDFCLKAQLFNHVLYRALLEGYTSDMWSRYTGVLIWKTQNPWTGLRGQFYDHLHDQTAGFYGCPSAAEPIHVQLNLETYSIEVVNTTSEELSNVAIEEASVWDLEGECPYNKTSEKLAVPPKKVIPTFEMEVSKVEESKASDDYKLLEPFRERRPPLKITSLTFIKGSSYEMRMHIQNTSKKPDSNTPLYRNNFIRRNGSFGELDSSESFYLLDGKKHEISLYVKNFSREYNKAMVSEVNGTGKGVAFFLHFSVHASKKEHNKVEDTRILPVHYSDNYFSLVPGEVVTVTISFEVPPGVTPQVVLYNSSSSCHRLVLDVKMFTLLVLRSEVYHYNCKEVGSKAVALMFRKQSNFAA